MVAAACAVDVDAPFCLLVRVCRGARVALASYPLTKAQADLVLGVLEWHKTIQDAEFSTVDREQYVRFVTAWGKLDMKKVLEIRQRVS